MEKNSAARWQAETIPDETAFILRYESLSLDILRRQVVFNGGSASLTPSESALLYALMRRGGEIVTRESLHEAAGLDEHNTVLATHMTWLRRKLNGSGYQITPKRGKGYMLEPENLNEKKAQTGV